MGLGLISNDTTVNLGETAVLTCLGFGEPEVNIFWSYMGRTLRNTSLLTIVEEISQLDFKTSYLQLCDLIRSESGEYMCTVTNTHFLVNATTQLSVAAVPGENPLLPSQQVSLGANFCRW